MQQWQCDYFCNQFTYFYSNTLPLCLSYLLLGKYKPTLSLLKYSVHGISCDLSVSGATKNVSNLRTPTNAFTNNEVTIGTKYIGSRSKFIRESAANVVFGSKVLPVM
jgi:hypothetical protein